MDRRITPADRKKIADYRKKLPGYERPSVTADIIAVRPAYSELELGQWRENPQFALEVLFIKRGEWPYEGCWGLPGGFIKSTESVEDGAKRELLEETRVEAKYLIPAGVFSKPGRDMRAWIISNAFVCVLGRGDGDHVKGGSDAAEARWLRLIGPTMNGGTFKLPFYDGGRPVFCLQGTYRSEPLDGGRILTVDDNPLAFDHAEIIAQSFLRMLAYDPKKIAFFFLPDKFTLASYTGIYEYLTQKKIDRNNIPNFRRQLTSTGVPLLVPCGGEMEDLAGRGHAPAKLYRKNF